MIYGMKRDVEGSSVEGIEDVERWAGSEDVDEGRGKRLEFRRNEKCDFRDSRDDVLSLFLLFPFTT